MTKHADKIAEAMGFDYLFDGWARANFRFDRLRGPYLLELLPTSGSFRFANDGRVYNTEVRQFGFYDKCALDFDSAEAFGIVDRMKAAALHFVRELNKTGDFDQLPETLDYVVQFDRFDVNVCGILLTLKLTPLPGECYG